MGSTVKSIRGNWWTSTAVLSVAAIALVLIDFLRQLEDPLLITGYACVFLVVAGYVFAASRTVERSGLAAGLIIAAGALVYLSRLGLGGHAFNSAGSLFYATAPAVVLAPLAWGLARRRGSQWLLSLFAAPLLWVVGSRLALDIGIHDSSSPFFGGLVDWSSDFLTVSYSEEQMNGPFAFILPALLVGLLGWGIDAYTDRHGSTAPTDPAADRHGHVETTHLSQGEVPGPVTVRGTRPPSWGPHSVGAALLVLWWLGVVWCASSGQSGIAIFLGLLGAFFTFAYLMSLVGTVSAIGRAQATADSQGIRTWRFTYRWDEIIACDFLDASVVYGSVNTQRTTASKAPRTSLVVTLRKADRNGRPIQVGYTLHPHHTNNLEEFKRAAQLCSPTLALRTAILVEDYVIDAQSRETLAQQFLAEGSRLVSRDRRGSEKIRLDEQSITNQEATVSLSRIAAMVAVTDVFTTKTIWPGGISSKSSERTHRLVLVGDELGPDGMPVSVRLDYPADYTPTLEQFFVSVRRIAPHIQLSDRRTTG